MVFGEDQGLVVDENRNVRWDGSHLKLELEAVQAYEDMTILS